MRRPDWRAAPPWVLDQWPDAVMLTDRHGVIEYVNRAFEKLTGYRREEVLGRTPAMLSSGRRDGSFYRRLWTTLRRGRAFRGVFVNRRKGGELFHEEETIRPLRAPGGRIAGFVSAGRDVSARIRQLESLRHSATHDPLTGLPNRALYADRLAQALRGAHRRGEGLVVAMMDVDRFKGINTLFGHLAGDEALKLVAARTLACVRGADTVARIGGDEFALVLSGTRSRAAAGKVLEKIRAANAAPVRHAGRRIPVSVSIGAMRYPDDARRELTLRKRADAALYAAKAAGGNRWKLGA